MRKIYRFEDLGLCGEIILKWIFKKWGGRHGLDLSGKGKGQITCAFDIREAKLISQPSYF